MGDDYNAEIENSLELLRNYIEQENFRGYDPYDTLNSVFPFSKFGRTFSILALQFQKRNPLNIRPLLLINKESNNMALGLLLKAYCRLQQNFVHKNYQSQCGLLFKLIKEGRSKLSNRICWGYNFDWPTKSKLIAKDTPNVVVSSFVCSALYEYHLTFKSDEAADLLKGCADWVLSELKRTEDKTGICFSYTPIGSDCCYNASLFAALILSQAYSISGDEKLLTLIEKAVAFVVTRQHEDGRWNYSIDLRTGIERKQVDFHQGFILDTLDEIQKLTGRKMQGVDAAIRKGSEFYFKEQFLTNGRSMWRLPKSYPVDIHNQSQGIITFTRFFSLNRDFLPFAGTVAGWTIRNMQSAKGFFYYRMYPLYKIRISYMRWAQANMFLALTELLIQLKNKDA